MQSLKKIHAWAQMKVPLWTSGSGDETLLEIKLLTMARVHSN